MENLKILFLMDPQPTLNLETETSLLLMEELLSLGHEVFWIEMDQVYLSKNRVRGFPQKLLSVAPLLRGKSKEQSLDDYDAIVIRKDPPFDLNYLHLTFLLDFLDSSVVQINPAKVLREANEKLFAMQWPDLVPETITTMNPLVIKNFLREHHQIVVKPLDECSGRGIEKIEIDDSEWEEKIDSLCQDLKGNPRYITAQIFLKEIEQGDKRVYLVNGEVVGMVNRVPAKGNFLGNIHQGARCESTELTQKEEEMIKEIRPLLQEKGLFLVGVDFIGEKITEINLTSPSAVRQINEVMGQRIEKKIVGSMLEYIQNHQIPFPLTHSRLWNSQQRLACC